MYVENGGVLVFAVELLYSFVHMLSLHPPGVGGDVGESPGNMKTGGSLLIVSLSHFIPIFTPSTPGCLGVA